MPRKFDIDQGRYRQVYKFLIEYKRENDGNTPTIREIAEALGFSSTSLSRHYLNGLDRIGLIRREKLKSRGVEIVGGYWGFANESRTCSSCHWAYPFSDYDYMIGEPPDGYLVCEYADEKYPSDGRLVDKSEQVYVGPLHFCAKWRAQE